ncbi:hypothetical protein LOK49_LG01G02981 [Camellia lanceoleosa]|uniref:Uncharacterized protein n=1 Tax=Camellia lanceoleosa TaxID=1840588 RepID=A0ACC0IY69_9ERIC|nr:hypothetical protein LOK49_LG01G02981 [Camellia lanceoleosa]
MATRVTRVANLASSLIGIVGRGYVSKIRWVSSLSEASLKPNKKITNRLFGVISAVNDRKLPSKLRGQRNAIRLIWRVRIKVRLLGLMFMVSDFLQDLCR